MSTENKFVPEFYEGNNSNSSITSGKQRRMVLRAVCLFVCRVQTTRDLRVAPVSPGNRLSQR